MGSHRAASSVAGFWGKPVLLYRGESGSIAALEDRCCHRGLPLSHGCVRGEQIRCGYHGLTFDARGLCVHVPGQERIPPAARVHGMRLSSKIT
jgi:phenylpropionate dioxygenase-like ring-hydroxylating dioxygenase large terminal subunit